MNDNRPFALLALLAIVLLGCGFTFFFIGARLINSELTSTRTDLSLTPEEKNNCGRHTYQLEEELSYHSSSMDEDSGVKKVITKFYGITMTTSIHDLEFTKVAVNEYESLRGRISQYSNIDRHVNTITFTVNGFTEHYAYEGPEGNLIDCWIDTYTITDLR